MTRGACRSRSRQPGSFRFDEPRDTSREDFFWLRCLVRDDFPGVAVLAKPSKVNWTIGKLQMRRGERCTVLMSRTHGRLQDACREQGPFDCIRRLLVPEQMLDRVREGHEQVAVPPRAGVKVGRLDLGFPLSAQ